MYSRGNALTGMIPDYRTQKKIDGLVARAIENFQKNHCDEEECTVANEKAFVKKLIFNPASIQNIDCSLCARFGVKIPKDALDVFKHLKGYEVTVSAKSMGAIF